MLSYLIWRAYLGCYAFARHEHLAPPIDRDHDGRSGAPPRAHETIVGVQLWRNRYAAEIGPVIATISDRRRGTLPSGQCTRNDCERLRDTFGAFMKAFTSSGYGNLPWLPR